MLLLRLGAKEGSELKHCEVGKGHALNILQEDILQGGDLWQHVHCNTVHHIRHTNILCSSAPLGAVLRIRIIWIRILDLDFYDADPIRLYF